MGQKPEIDRSRVFVTQDSGRLDFSNAERFGRLVPVLERDVFPDDGPARVGTMLRLMRSRLRDYDPVTDFLLLAGDPIGIFIAAVVLAESGHRWFRCLKWDRECRAYYPVDVMAA